MCIGCRRVASDSDLVRVVRAPGGELSLGRTLGGRGAWLCPGSPTCVDRAARRGSFGQAFRAPVSPEAVERLRAVVCGDTPTRSSPEVCEDGMSGRPAGLRPREEKGL